MVVWRFWQQSCCHSIPSTAMARNSCCVMWPSLPLHASFLIFWPGRLNLRPTGHDLWSLRSLSRILHHLLNKAPALCVAWHCLLWQRTLLPTFLTVDCIIWAVVILPTYFSQSYRWCLGILRWIRSCAVLRNYCQHWLKVSFHGAHNVYFIFWKSVVFLNRVLQSKHLGRVQQMYLFQEGETWRVLSSRSVIIDLETARFATL